MKYKQIKNGKAYDLKISKEMNIYFLKKKTSRENKKKE